MYAIEKTGTGTIERTGTGAIERTGTGAIERTGTGAIERTGTGAIERTGTGRMRWALYGLLFALSTYLPAALAAQVHQVGSMLISSTSKEIAVTWHVETEDRLAIIAGSGFVEAGYALIDLYDAAEELEKVVGTGTGNDKLSPAPWGQLEIRVNDDGSLDGTLFEYDSAKNYRLKAGGRANFLMEEQDWQKVVGTGTGN